MSRVNKKMSDAQIERAATLFAALAEASRLRLLQALLHGGEMTVSALVEATGLSQANVSKHLSGLHTARMVAKERQGVYVSYRISDPVVQSLCGLVCEKIERDAERELKTIKGMNA